MRHRETRQNRQRKTETKRWGEIENKGRNNFKTSVLKMGQRGRKGKGEREKYESGKKCHI